MFPISPFIVRWAVLLVLGSAIGGYGYLKGKLHEQTECSAKWSKFSQTQTRILTKLVPAQTQITTTIQQSTQQKVETIHEQAKTIIQKIPTYLPAKVVDTCPVPSVFIWLLNASANPSGNEISPPASGAEIGRAHV